MPAFKSILAATVLASLANSALAYNGKATSYAGAGEAVNGGGTGFNVSAAAGQPCCFSGGG